MKATEVFSKTEWAIDQVHSAIIFKVRQLLIAQVNGAFKSYDASIYTYGRDFTTSEIDLWINVSSLSTGDEMRDKHLKSRDFFNVKKYKQITFRSGNIVQADENGNYELWGDLTMMGVTKNIQLNVQFGGILNNPWGNECASFTVTGKINRSDWGLTWNSSLASGGLMVSDEVVISCEVELTKINPNHHITQTEPVVCEEYVL